MQGIKNRVKEEREKQEMTQVELAEKADVSRVVLSGIESGTRMVVTSSTMEKLATALNVGIGDIFF